MAAEPEIREADDRPKVTLGNEQDTSYWTERLRVTRAQLEEAVSAVGDDAHAVHTYLRGQGGGD